MKLPQLVNIAELKTARSRHVMIHCTDQQWARLIKGAVKATRMPKSVPYIEAVRYGPGGVLLNLFCEGEGINCHYELVDQGNGNFAYECVCLQKPKPPDIRLCRFVFGGNPPRLRCEAVACPHGCRLTIRPGPLPRIFCACRF